MRLAILLIFAPLIGTAADFQSSAAFHLRPEVALELRASRFDASEHKITKNNSGLVRLIDGRQVFGTDGGLPHTQLDSAVLIIEGVKVPLDVGQMYDPWLAAPSHQSFTLTQYEDGWILTGLFSDGAGTYLTRWRILSGTSLRQVISDDEDIVSLFHHSSHDH
jgi:hypothetical protein